MLLVAALPNFAADPRLRCSPALPNAVYVPIR
jgi:hypothetical protein